MNVDLAAYVEGALDGLAPAARALCPDGAQVVREGLAAVVAARGNDTRVAERTHALCPVEGATLSDYGLRELGLSTGTRVLAAIHFFGLDRTKPFVGVIGSTRPLLDARELQELVLQLSAAFKVLSPHAVRVWRAAGAPAPDGGPFRRWAGNRLLVGNITALLDRPPPTGAQRVELVPTTSLGFYQDYRGYYAAFHRARPEMALRVQCERRDSLASAAARGALCLVYLDGKQAGVIAADRGREQAFAGWVVLEQVLSPAARGQGLAAAMQRRFVEHLSTLNADRILGTIDSGNHPSLRTAARVGRWDVGGYDFLFMGDATPWFADP